MSTVAPSNRISELRRAVRQADSGAFLVEARVVRRVIREMHGFARLSSRIPHPHLQIISDRDVRSFIHPDELELPGFGSLPQRVLLIAQPEEAEMESRPVQDLLQVVWRQLFHGVIDRTLKEKVSTGAITRAVVQQRIAAIGQVEFDEAHAVLRSELTLIHPESRMEAYLEFAAVFLEFAWFSPDLLSTWFPSFPDRAAVIRVLTKDVNAQQIMESTHLYGATAPDLTPETMRDEAQLVSVRNDWFEGIGAKPSKQRYARQMKRRSRWNDRGNTVAAGVAAMQASDVAPSEEDKQTALQAAADDMMQLVERLRAAINFDPEDSDDWLQSLNELLRNSVQGFWNSDKRLLYDLQKVCLDHERTTYKVDLVKWIVSRGKRPLRRPLTNLREVMMAKHLASSAARLVYVRLSGAERERLSDLLHKAARLSEEQMRHRMRSALQETLLQVGLTPSSVPEQVAFDKLVEESLDCIAERGYLTMGYLRDAISRNDLKLPDLTDPRELIRGDHLLRTDDRLDLALDGVYRRGEFYLRWLQVVSSLAFGTRTGRFGTLFIAIPFGGAMVIVVGAKTVFDKITGKGHVEADLAAAGDPETETGAADDNDSELLPATSTNSSDPAVEKAEPDSVASSDGIDTTRPDTPASASTAIPTVLTDDSTGPPEAPSEETTPTTSETVGVADPIGSPYNNSVIDLQVAIVVVGFLLMALVHLPAIRTLFFNLVRYGWNVLKLVVYDTPLRIIRLPVIRHLLRSRWFINLRRYVLSPFVIAWLGCRVVPAMLGADPRQWWWVVGAAALLSGAVNSRLGRDAEELTAEWVSNVWYNLRAHVMTAIYDWIIDFFKWILNVVERFIYAVDEWLRFHSNETWLTLVVKAVVGLVWSFVAFLLRIYVNLLIEPTLHPVKHFPVVTVAHKMFLPVILIIRRYMHDALTPYLGPALAEAITWFNILFLPGIFGFLVWELKENWRLYASNRIEHLRPVAVGSHGETVLRLMKPGFHSGTLPKLFARLRRLERKEASFHRFGQRRAFREALLHTERDVRRFVERDLIRLLEYCPVWNDFSIHCDDVRGASNSIHIQLSCRQIGAEPLHLLFLEQSGWAVATIEIHGWLDQASPEQQHSFESALLGFYRKAGVELVREQMERNLIGKHEYDICETGIMIWPEAQFDREITVDLNRRHQLRPTPTSLAASYGLQPVARESVVFSQSEIPWADWKQLWASPLGEDGKPSLPMACVQSARLSLISR